MEIPTKGRLQRTRLKKEARAQIQLREARGNLHRQEQPQPPRPHLKVADARSRKRSRTYFSSSSVLLPSPCPGARQEKQEHPPLLEGECQMMEGQSGVSGTCERPREERALGHTVFPSTSYHKNWLCLSHQAGCRKRSSLY